MIAYVVGFAFRPRLTGMEVVLIRKTKPAWQAGKLNGVGGKIEAGELATEAMAREFEEETGVVLNDWVSFTEMRCKDCVVYCFAAWLPNKATPHTTTEEGVEVGRWTSDGKFSLPNLDWLIPMAKLALEERHEGLPSIPKILIFDSFDSATCRV
jgi:8-oxo-dGTP diphosphatase